MFNYKNLSLFVDVFLHLKKVKSTVTSPEYTHIVSIAKMRN